MSRDNFEIVFTISQPRFVGYAIVLQGTTLRLRYHLGRRSREVAVSAMKVVSLIQFLRSPTNRHTLGVGMMGHPRVTFVGFIIGQISLYQSLGTTICATIQGESSVQ